MKTIYIYRIVALLFLHLSLEAQISLNGLPKIKNVGCQHSSLGGIAVDVLEIHSPYSYTWNTGQTTREINDLEAGDYALKIEDATGADTLLKFTIITTECQLSPELFFTPNGDGVNDVWGISYAHLFPNALIAVYNRLGQKVFELSGLYTREQWDGTDNFGTPLPPATYYFIVFSDKADRKKPIKGTVSIIR